MTHHKTWFPVVVVALTALLGLFIFSVFKERIGTSVRPTTPVTAVEYQAQVHANAGELRTILANAASDDQRLAQLTHVREQLLTLLVPAEYKDVHLEMVMTLSQWIAGYQGAPDKAASAALRWQALVDQYSWIE